MKNPLNVYKIKDFVLMGIVTAIYTVLFMVIGFSSAAFNALAHALSPAIFGLIGGTIILFLLIKIPKFGVFTLLVLLMQALFSILGSGYLPWLIATLVTAVIADLIACTSQYKSTLKNAVAYGLIQMGFSAGGVIPAMFFAESYKKTFIDRGMSAEQMETYVASSVGWLGVIVLVLSFIGGFAGILIGKKILAKCFKKD